MKKGIKLIIYCFAVPLLISLMVWVLLDSLLLPLPLLVVSYVSIIVIIGEVLNSSYKKESIDAINNLSELPNLLFSNRKILYLCLCFEGWAILYHGINNLIYILSGCLIILMDKKINTISDQKKNLRNIGIFLMGLAISAIFPMISDIKLMQMALECDCSWWAPQALSFVQKDIPFLGFLCVMGLLTAFGCLFYLKGTRTVVIVLSIISSIYLIKEFKHECGIYDAQWNQDHSIGFIDFDTAPALKMILYLMLIGLFIHIVIFMLQKNTKEIFERKGKIDDIAENISKPKLWTRIIIIVPVIVLAGGIYWSIVTHIPFTWFVVREISW